MIHTDLKDLCEWQYGKWMERLGIGWGFNDCQGKTIERVIDVVLYSDLQTDNDFSYFQQLIVFSDGTRRLSVADTQWVLVYDPDRLVASGVITSDELALIEAGITADQQRMDAESDRRRRAQGAANASYWAAYNAG